MKLEDYPPQEPLSEAGQAYSLECFRRSEGIAYEESGYGDSPWQRIAVYRAPKPDGNVLVCWHGGGWTSGYKEWMGFMAPALNAAGITLVSPGYRLAPQTLWPGGLADCISAVRWTHDNIARFGGDPGRIFLGGHSAGGHYSTLLAVTRDWRAPAGLPADLIRGALPISGVYDFTPGNGMASRPRFLGSDESNDRKASPLHRMEKPLPPMLVAWGSNDFPHLAKQAEVFVDAVRAAGGDVHALRMEGRTHFSAHYAGGESDGPWVPEAIRFIQGH